jgi:hypothetical protein
MCDDDDDEHRTPNYDPNATRTTDDSDDKRDAGR